MAEFDPRERIEGLVCETSAIGGLTERLYKVVFKREDATIDQIEKISWKRPAMNDYCKLPIGFAFNMKSINYNSRNKTYEVILILRDQYLGDVTRYQTEIASKDETIHTMETTHATEIAEKDSTITGLSNQLAEADEAVVTIADQLNEADNTIIEMRSMLEEADNTITALYEQLGSVSEDTNADTPTDSTTDATDATDNATTEV